MCLRLCASFPAVQRGQGISDTIKYAATRMGKAEEESGNAFDVKWVITFSKNDKYKV